MRSLIVAVGLYSASAAEDVAGADSFEGAGVAQALTKTSKAADSAVRKQTFIRIPQSALRIGIRMACVNGDVEPESEDVNYEKLREATTAAELMRMPMMEVGIMRVGMFDPLMPVRMRVRLARRIMGRVLMLVMFVMYMFMLMHHRLMNVPMLMDFSKV
jgi:hypothetical protein